MKSFDEFYHLLVENDHPNYSESPPGFDRQSAWKRFHRLAESVNQVVGKNCDYETEYGIQDASFHGEICVPLDKGLETCYEGIRASNFGNFIRVSNENGVLPNELLTSLKRLFSDLGYLHIPNNVLGTKYTGLNPGVSGFSNWERRYFDYI